MMWLPQQKSNYSVVDSYRKIKATKERRGYSREQTRATATPSPQNRPSYHSAGVTVRCSTMYVIDSDAYATNFRVESILKKSLLSQT